MINMYEAKTNENIDKLESFETPGGVFWLHKSILIQPYVIFDSGPGSAFKLWACYGSLGLMLRLMLCYNTFGVN